MDRQLKDTNNRQGLWRALKIVESEQERILLDCDIVCKHNERYMLKIKECQLGALNAVWTLIWEDLNAEIDSLLEENGTGK